MIQTKASTTLTLLLFLSWSATIFHATDAFSTRASIAAKGTRKSTHLLSSPQGGGPPTSVVPTAGRPGGPPQQQGGPPPQGGPPQGGGPPPGAGPGGPPKGGPPPQTKAQKLLEQGLDVAFNFLYLGDEIGLQDSSKNLRVLWTRSILNQLGKIDDPIAYELLPKKTRWVAKIAAKFFPKSVLEKLDWIVQRTDFIDGQLQSFLKDTENNGAPRQVLVLGSGYDTRCLRYGNLPGLNFYCVDLPDVASNSEKVIARYRADIGTNPPDAPTFIPLDLNTIGSEGKSILETLSKVGFVTDGSIPTMVLCEAVLFYLTPDAAQSITSELFSLQQSRYCLTDNLSKVGVIPGGGPEGPPPIAARARCESWLTRNDKDLVDHDSIWGGAIHFVGAREASE